MASAGTIAAYALPAAVVWGILGIALSDLARKVPQMMVVTVAYAVAYGLSETAGLPLRPPSVSWQVPARWVRGRAAARVVIWGIALGPGLVTRNPYAGMGLLPLLLILYQNPMAAAAVGMLFGAVHGGVRAVGVLWNQRQMAGGCEIISVMGQHLRWRLVDGVALLLAAGGLVAYLVSRVA